VQAVVLAGGLATRLLPRTEQIPKSLVEVAGRPFIDWQLGSLRRDGYDEVLLCIGHLGEAVVEHVGDGARFGVRIRYSPDGPHLLGTAGALRGALDHLAPTFLVTYGDSFLPFDYASPLRDLDAHPDADGTMAVFRNEGAWDASNTEVSGERVVRYEKGTRDPRCDHIDYGATALRRKVVETLELGVPCGLDSVQTRLAATGRLRALCAPRRFYEIGSEAGLRDLEEALRSAQVPGWSRRQAHS
jgi:NDP-sugar pyrophosphorylase family protein